MFYFIYGILDSFNYNLFKESERCYSAKTEIFTPIFKPILINN